MTNPICSVKHKLDSAIQQLCNVSLDVCKRPFICQKSKNISWCVLDITE